MFSKQEQCSWIKIECDRGRTARQCHLGLQNPCTESTLPYRTVARWVKAFREGRQNVADMYRPGFSNVSEGEVHAVAALMGSDRRLTIRELTRLTGFAHTTVLHILKKRLGMRKTASRCSSFDVSAENATIRCCSNPPIAL
ncbi:HTH_48 domain-containing protein [Trichonephila clavipes]|nr:HTH_48 domain-containing protein [Trichonephila clavipes]